MCSASNWSSIATGLAPRDDLNHSERSLGPSLRPLLPYPPATRGEGRKNIGMKKPALAERCSI
jgi:hypothetical protein